MKKFISLCLCMLLCISALTGCSEATLSPQDITEYNTERLLEYLNYNDSVAVTSYLDSQNMGRIVSVTYTNIVGKETLKVSNGQATYVIAIKNGLVQTIADVNGYILIEREQLLPQTYDSIPFQNPFDT